MSSIVEMTPGIRALWREEIALDLTIEVEDREFKVHKVVMAGLCDYFKAMFRAGMKDSATDRVRLEGFSAKAVSNIINYIYTSQFGRHIAPAEELLKLVVYLQFPRGIEACEEHLIEEHLDPTNCLSSLSLFKAFSLKQGIEYIVKYMKEHFDDVMTECKPDTLPLEDLLNLMDCWNRPEGELFELALQWLENDDRKQHVNQVMGHVRFALLSPAEITAIKDMPVYHDYAGSWCELIDKALAYHNLPTHKRVLDDSEQTMVRSESTPVCFPAKSSKNYLFSQEDKWSWKKIQSSRSGQELSFMRPELTRGWHQHKTENTPKFRNPPTKFVVANNFLIVSDELGWSYIPHPDVKWYIFDPRRMAWSKMASLNVDRINLALVYHNKHLYAMGGIPPQTDTSVYYEDQVSDIIERYDFETDTWTVIPSKLPVPLHGHTALSVEGLIYVVGGSRAPRYSEDFCPRMDAFDPSTNTWTSKSSIQRTTEFMKIQVMELKGKPAISILDQNHCMQYYTPSGDGWGFSEWKVWHGQRRGAMWHQFVKWHDEGSVVAKGRYLYLLNVYSNSGKEHACAKVDFHECGGPESVEIGLEDFPLGEKRHFCTLLSINHKYVKEGDEEPPLPISEDSDSASDEDSDSN